MNSRAFIYLLNQSYLPARLVALLAIVASILLTACDRQPEATGFGSIAGVIQLSNPDPTTGHAGTLVYLAGTPYQARTDQMGRYRIDGIPAGTYDVVAEKQGFQGQVIEGVLINPAVHGSESPMQPGSATLAFAGDSASTSTSNLAELRGRVLLQDMVDQNGGVRVEVDGTAFVTVSSSDGQYRLVNVDPGTYTLSYYKEGFRPFTSLPVEVTSGVITLNEVGLELVQPGDPVSPAAAATAEAVKTAGAIPTGPPPGPTEPRSIVGIVELIGAGGQLVSNYEDVTVAINGTDNIAQINEQGQFRFDNLTSGTYTVIGTIENGPMVQIPVDLETQRRASIAVRLNQDAAARESNGSITGRVVLVDMNDQPLPQAAGVQVAVAGTQEIATTAADGSFTLANVPTGTHTISASADNFETAQVPEVVVNAETAANVGDVRMVQKVDRPRVVSTNPTDKARDVVVGFDLPIQVKFSARMNPGSVRDAISITPSTPYSALIGKGAGQGADDDTLVINLSNDNERAPIQFGANYRITINDTAESIEGVAMAEPYTFTFRTANPGVIQTSPQNGENRAYVDQLENPVLITFNTRLDPDTINERNIRVRPDNGLSVATTYTNSDTNGWTTIRVATQWQANTAYTVTVSRRVKAFNGQSLGNTPYTLRFRTAPLEILTMPILETR